MEQYWGMEFVEVIDPKQPEGTRVDAMTYALLNATGYYERLRMECYAAQFVNVFYQKIIVPVLHYLDELGITPDVVVVTQPDGFMREIIRVQIDDLGYDFLLRFEQLTDARFPDYAISHITHLIETRHRNERVRYQYNIMSDSERDYLDAVMRERGFTEMDYSLYFNPHFEAFRDKGLLVKQYGMFWMPSDDAIRMWQLNQPK